MLPNVTFLEATTKDVLLKKVFLKIRKFHRKTPMLESHFIKVTAFRHATFLKGTPIQEFSSEICRIFQKIYFEEHL